MLSFGLSASLVLVVSCAAAAVQGGRPPDKGSRTPAQRKLDSHLLQEIARRQGKSRDAPKPGGATLVKIDKDARALVEVHPQVALHVPTGQAAGERGLHGRRRLSLGERPPLPSREHQP